MLTALVVAVLVVGLCALYSACGRYYAKSRPVRTIKAEIAA